MKLSNLLLHDLPGQLPADHRRDWVPGGYLGTAATIERMREFVTQYKRDFNIRKLAAQIIQNCPAKDYYCYARAIYEFCRDRIKYVYDPHLVELVESPTRILEAGIADCDSICTLMGSLNESIGLKTRFRTIKADSKRPDDFSHVYCMVRVPQSRFSTSKISGWIAEDATLPDKQFGWEPNGNFPKKDWAASKDKDGEDGDDPLLGDITMSPVNESQAQIEIDQLCSALNMKLIEAMRKGLEWSDPKKANILAVVVGRFTQLANGANGVTGGTSPSQLLPAVRNGYAQWTQVIDDASAAIPDFGVTPNLSGYSNMGADVVSDETYKTRIQTYLNTVDWKLQNLKSSGAESKYPAEMSNIRIGLYSMQNLASQIGALGAEKTEMAVQKAYKTTVQQEIDLARKMGTAMSYPEGTFASPQAATKSWWETLLDPVGAVASAIVPPATTGGTVPTVKPTPMTQMLTKPDVAPSGTSVPGGVLLPYTVKDGYTPAAPSTGVMATIQNNLPIILGVAVALGVLYYLSRQPKGGA